MASPWENVAGNTPAAPVSQSVAPTSPWASASVPSSSPIASGQSGTVSPWSRFQSAENSALGAAGHVGSALSRALDYPGFLVRKAITGSGDTDTQMLIERKALGLEPTYEQLANAGWLGHLAAGTIDTVLQTAQDPTMLLVIPFLRGASVAGKALEYGGKGLRAVANADNLAGSAVRTLGRPLQWGYDVGRTLGPEARDTARGAANLGSRAQADVTMQMQRMARAAVAPLTDEQIAKVGNALNKAHALTDLDEAERAALSPQEQRAFNQLRRLTETDYKIRSNIWQKKLFDAHTAGMTPQDRASVWKALQEGKEPVVPEGAKRVKTPYGEPVEHTRNIPPGTVPDWEKVYEEAQVGLSPADQQILGRAIVDKTMSTEGLRPDLADRIARVRQAIETKYSAPGAAYEKTVTTTAPRYKMPFENAAQIEHAEKLRDTYRAIIGDVEKNQIAYREKYLPGTHLSRELQEDRDAFAGNTLNPEDPRTEQRGELKGIGAETVRKGFDALGKNLGLQVGAARIRTALGDLLNEPEIQKLFEKTYAATGSKRTDLQKLGDAWKSVIGYPRAAIVSLTPRHVVNILDLLVNTDPGALPATMKLATRLMLAKNPKEYENLVKPGAEMGALAGQYLERKPFFGGVPLVGKYTDFINKLTWAVDDAAKTVYAQRLHAKGLDKLVAGGRAARELVDYANTAPMVNALRYVAPFATFRGSIPGAVLGGVARNPARASLLNRATGGAMYGTEQGKSGQKEWYGPTADVADLVKPGASLIDNPYLRATLGTPLQGAITLGRETLPGKEQPARSRYAQIVKDRAERFYTYGNPVDLKWLVSAALAGVPEAQTVVQQLGYGPFPIRHPEQNIGERMGREILRQSTGVEAQGQ